MIKRTLLSSLEEHLLEPEMTILTGPRQVGKTYLMSVMEDHLKEKGEKTLYINLDYDEHTPLFKSQGSLIDYIKLQVGEGKAYIFIDEIQRKENADIFLKGIADRHLQYKFIISGSGSLELKAKIKESMAGRKRIFIVNPLSFEEFVNFKTNYQYEDKLKDFFAIEEGRTQNLLEEYISYGGYPKVVLAETSDKKKTAMDEIYTSYVEKDIGELLGVEKTDAFSNLVKILASQVGSLVNTVELSSTVGIVDKTIQHYLWYLEQTFILKKVTPYYSNVRKEISKAPIYYFYDTGLRNFMLGLFGLPSIPPALSGHLFENVVFNTLKQIISAPTAIHFWRTRDHAEVDFVLQDGLQITPIEAKYMRLEKPGVSRSYRNFLARYKPKNGYIINLGKEQEIIIDDTRVRLIPYPHLITEKII